MEYTMEVLDRNEDITTALTGLSIGIKNLKTELSQQVTLLRKCSSKKMMIEDM
jgi:hypothetical protein